MRIGLIADTHIPEAGPEVPPQVFAALQGVDLVLHAGDLHVLRVLDDLQRIAPVLCARGNGDHPDPFNPKRPGVPEDPRVRESHVLTLEGWTLGLTHGFPAPDEPAWQDISRAMRHYFGRMVDIVVCGDTHMEQVHERDGVLFVNPGSPTLPRQVRRLGTVAVLEVGQGFRRASIKNLGIVSA